MSCCNTDQYASKRLCGSGCPAPSNIVIKYFDEMSKYIVITGGMQTGATIVVGYRIKGSPTWIYLPSPLTSSDLPYTISDLPDGDYEVQITQNCANGTSSPPTVYDPVPISCNPPTITTGTITPNSVQLIWGPILVGQTYDLYKDGVLIAAGISGSPYLATGLSELTQYSFQIKVKTLYGDLNCTSNSVLVETTDNPPDPCPPITDLIFSVGQTTATVTWSSPGGSVLSYDIYLDNVLIASNWPSTNYSLSGLTAGSTHTFGVVTNCSESEGSLYSEPFTLLPIVCDPPLFFSATTTGINSIELNWAPQAGNIGYIISWTGGADVTLGLVSTYTFSGLTPSTLYGFSIVAICADGTSLPVTAQATTWDPCSLVPESIVFTGLDGSFNLNYFVAMAAVGHQFRYRLTSDPPGTGTLVTNPTLPTNIIVPPGNYTVEITLFCEGDVPGPTSTATTTVF